MSDKIWLVEAALCEDCNERCVAVYDHEPTSIEIEKVSRGMGSSCLEIKITALTLSVSNFGKIRGAE